MKNYEEGRLRDIQVHVRMTASEYAKVKTNFQESGKMNMNDFIVETAVNGYTINIDYSQLKELCYEINRIGNNINQIAHKVNSTDIVYQTDIDEIRDDMKKIVGMVRQQFYSMPEM